MLNPFKRQRPDFQALKPQFEASLQTILVNSLVASCTVLEKHFGFSKEQLQRFSELWNSEMDWIAKTQRK